MSQHPVVFVVDDDAAIRHSLGALLDSVGLAVETFASASAFLDAYNPRQPGCILLDIRMPGMSGLQLQDALVSQPMTQPIIFISAHGDTHSAVRAMKQGAFDFLEKPVNPLQLIDLVQRAIHHDTQRRQVFVYRSTIRQRLESLSKRERVVLDMVVDGHANKQIASKLGLSQRTIEGHRNHVMQKMNADSLATLVRMVVEAD